jgi:hypothetical protein
MNHDYIFLGEYSFLNKINNFLPKPEQQWVYTENCYNCKSIFGYLTNTQHHCRGCGRCFCANCSTTISIPHNLIYCPPEPQYKETIKNINKINKINKLSSWTNYMKFPIYANKQLSVNDYLQKLVCNNCYMRISNLNNISININILKFCDLKTVQTMSCVNNDYYYAYLYIRFKYEHIRYKNINKYNQWEIGMIQNNMSNISSIKYIMWKIHYERKIYIPDIDQNQKKFNIFDLIDVLVFITNYEKDIKMFWDSDVKKIFHIFIKNVIIDNENVLLTSIPLLAKLISHLFTHIDDMSKLDSDLIFLKDFFDLISPTELSTTLFVHELRKYIDEKLRERPPPKQINKIPIMIFKKLNTRFNIALRNSFVKMDNFIIEHLFKPSILSLENDSNMSRINALLPVMYPFDYDYDIINIVKLLPVDDDKFGLACNKIIKLEIKHRKNLNTKEVIVLINGINIQTEYPLYIIIKMLYQTIGYTGHYNETYQFLGQATLVKVEDNVTSLATMRKHNKCLIDLIYGSNLDRQINQMIDAYSNSLSMLLCLIYIFKFDIKYHREIVINDNAQIYYSRFSLSSRNNSENPKILFAEIFGSKNSKIYKDFIDTTQQYYNKIRKILPPNLINFITGEEITKDIFIEFLDERTIENII